MSYAGWMGLILASVSIGLTGSAASASTPTPAVPTGSPGEWVTAGDYPALVGPMTVGNGLVTVLVTDASFGQTSDRVTMTFVP